MLHVQHLLLLSDANVLHLHADLLEGVDVLLDVVEVRVGLSSTGIPSLMVCVPCFVLTPLLHLLPLNVAFNPLW